MNRNTIGTFLNNQAEQFSKSDDKQVIGIEGFRMFVHIRRRVTRTAELPTSPLEDGSFANDHIILNPIRIEVEGRVDEVIAQPSATMELMSSVNKNLGVITKYGPYWTQTQQQRIDAMSTTILDASRKIDNVLNDGKSLFDIFSSESPENGNASNFLEYMELLYETRRPFRVEVEGDKVYENMFMVSWSTDSDNEMRYGIKYSMTFQQLNFATIAYSKATPAPHPADAVKDAVSEKVNKGVTEGTKTDLITNLGRLATR